MKSRIALAIIFISFFSIGSLFADEDVVVGQTVRKPFLILSDTSFANNMIEGQVRYTVYEDGEYTVHVASRGQPVTVIRRGDLGYRQMDELKEYLVYRCLNSMPESLGKDITFDDATYVISLQWDNGSEMKVVELSSTYGSLESVEMEYAKNNDPDAVHVDRFASIVKTIKSLCSE